MRIKILSLIARMWINFVGRTSRIKVVGEENVRQMKDSGKNVIYAFWHGRQFMLVYTHRYRNICIMTSLSQDGELQTDILNRFGYRTIRGSSTTGSFRATREIIRQTKGLDLAFAVDGPHGPIFQVKPGVLFIAQCTGRVIIPLTSAVRNFKLFNKAWDKYIFPFPLTTAVVIYGKPIELRREEKFIDRVKELETKLNELTKYADSLLNE